MPKEYVLNAIDSILSIRILIGKDASVTFLNPFIAIPPSTTLVNILGYPPIPYSIMISLEVKIGIRVVGFTAIILALAFHGTTELISETVNAPNIGPRI